jgi:ectoine hydroxylase-related dioxygenase (phytanoyl-CoA dioxygenase family)
MSEVPSELKERVARATKSFDAKGFLVLENCFSPSYIEELRKVFFDEYCSIENGEYQIKNKGIQVGHRRFMLMVDFKPPFNQRELYANPKLFLVLRELLGPRFVLDNFGAVLSLPGAQQQHIHHDHPNLFESLNVSADLPIYAITVGIPLVDLDLTIGSTAYWPGSHRMPLSRKQIAESGAPVCPQLKTGSCYLMDFRLIHGGMPNLSASPRPILYLAYTRPWFTDFQNFKTYPPIMISDEELNKIPQDDQPLFSRTLQLRALAKPELQDVRLK